MQDYVQRFLFDELDIRGAFVHLQHSWRLIQSDHGYSPPVRNLLGEMCAVTAIIAANLKQPGRLTFQLSGHGAVSLLVIDCSQTLNLRGYAKTESGIGSAASLTEMLGSSRLQMTLDEGHTRQPYQSHVPVEGDTLAEIFEHYLVQSEQQPAALWLAANADYAKGMFLQKLPGADLKDSDGWNRITQLAQTLTRTELLMTDMETLLQRLYHQEILRVFEPRNVTHDFPLDWDKIRSMLLSLGRKEIEDILAEHGEVVIRDDLSNHTYRFNPEEARALFESAGRLH
ncbi:MAG TPA: Hsp33 family molecular chaperone HslO [Rhodocyclaceae bacterium]|nr:Hsp33 family molecular chaperone HslO [Rhodocyclaceae bacterium]